MRNRLVAPPPCAWFLGGMSFAESSFFPIPPDVMLAPMGLANPARAWRFALIATLTSVAGGLFGYAIGHYAFDAIEPWLRESLYWDGYQAALHRYIDRLGWATVALVVAAALFYRG